MHYIMRIFNTKKGVTTVHNTRRCELKKMHTFIHIFLKYKEKLRDFKVSSLIELGIITHTCQNIGFHSDQEDNATQVQLKGITGYH